MSPAPAEQRFRFAGWELPGRLGPAPGRYVLRRFAGDDPQHVLVLLESARGGWRRGAPAVPVTRAAVIEAAPVDLAAARAWFDDAAGAGAPRVLAAGLAVLNRALAAHRIAAADPHVRELGPAAAFVARVGYGTGAQVSAAGWERAREVPVAAARARRPERLELLLSGRDAALACEELALRARADLTAGRSREAALVLRPALEAALSELEPWADRGDLRRRVDELAELRPQALSAYDRALEGGLDESEAQTVDRVLGRVEAALRARTASGVD